MLVEELPERCLRGGVLREDAPARDLGDVGRLEMDLQREAVHQAGKLDLLVVEAADELAELLLRGDDDPVLAATLDAEALHDGLQVEHLLDVASDELADLVDDEHQALARAAGASSARSHARPACPGEMSALFLTAFTHESAIGYVSGSRLCSTRLASLSAKATLPFSASHSFSKRRPVLVLEPRRAGPSPRARSPARRGRGPSRSRGSGGRART